MISGEAFPPRKPEPIDGYCRPNETYAGDHQESNFNANPGQRVNMRTEHPGNYGVLF